MNLAIQVERLTKRYGAYTAIDGISFEVTRGEIVGFLGPNGAGKSTTLRILAGFLGATSGRVMVAGHDVASDPIGARRAIGYMPEAVPLYPEMRVREYLRFRAELKGVLRKERAPAVNDAMAQAHVEDVADILIEHLSKGYRQRVGLADALVARPPLLILDEPTAGMDPNQTREVRALVRELAGERTVLWSTHILSEVEATCSRVVVIDKGHLVAQGTAEELARVRKGPCLELIVHDEAGVAHDCLKRILAIQTIHILSSDRSSVRLALEVAHDSDIDLVAEEITRTLVGAQVGVRAIGRAKASLDEAFAALTASEREQ